jgi:hypothetical protein
MSGPRDDGRRLATIAFALLGALIGLVPAAAYWARHHSADGTITWAIGGAVVVSLAFVAIARQAFSSDQASERSTTVQNPAVVKGIGLAGIGSQVLGLVAYLLTHFFPFFLVGSAAMIVLGAIAFRLQNQRG